MELKQVKMSVGVRIALGLFLALLSGGLFLLAFPPYGLWFFVFFGWAPMLIAQHRILPAKLSVLAPAVAIFVWLEGFLGPVFAPVGTFMVWLPLFVALLTLLTDSGLRTFNEKTGYRWFVLSGVVSWAGSEMIRLFIPIAGTWAFIAYPLYQQPWLIQPVSIFGIIGLGALIMLINFSLGLAAIGWLDRHYRLAEDARPIAVRLSRGWLTGAAAALAGWIILSLILFRPTGETLRVAAVQPAASPILAANASQDELVASLHARMLEQTRDAAAQGARFIVWPEGAMLWDPQVDDRLKFADLARETGSYLSIGYVVNEENGFRNEATVIDPQGNYLGVFGKDHPVTFGGETSLSRGTYPVYQTAIGTLGTIICYDLDYTDTARKLAQQGAQVIAVPSNDWSGIGDKHYAHVVFRAVENRTAMIKSDGGFDSAIIDPYGRIISLSSGTEEHEATLVGDVLIGSGKGTITSRLGDWMGWLNLAGMIFFAFGSGWLVKRAEKKA